MLCLHDELLVHTPTANGDTIAVLLADTLQEAARRFTPDDKVRFVADIAVIGRWSDAKTAAVPPNDTHTSDPTPTAARQLPDPLAADGDDAAIAAQQRLKRETTEDQH